LRAAFGTAAPQPYRYLDEQQGMLAYTTLDPESMRAQVALADPQAAQVLGLAATANHGGYNLRPFPTLWPKGKVLGFEVRVRPTIREGQTRHERDAFLHAVERSPGLPVQREAVKGLWPNPGRARSTSATCR
jgi:CRISPR system Cascade subunit CasE